ncbi:MAG: NAD(+) synthase [Clostridia bacterium]|nr:NAD(+) synthase [Clostridia bacterium]
MKKIKLGLIVPKIKLANTKYNTESITKDVKDAIENGAKIITTYELALTGFSCGDLFKYDLLLENAEIALREIAEVTKGSNAVVVIGMPARLDDKIYNGAAIIDNGEIKAFVSKENFTEPEETRYFTFETVRNQKISLCGNDDIDFSNEYVFKKDGITYAVRVGYKYETEFEDVDVLVNLIADPAIIGSDDNRLEYAMVESKNNSAVVMLCNAGSNESTSSVVYSGHSVIAKNGEILAETEKYNLEGTKLYYEVDVEERELNTKITAKEKIVNLTESPFVPKDEVERAKRCEEIIEIQATALARRLVHAKSQKAILGLSGGLDSTLAFLVIIRAFEKLDWDRKNIIAITMPCFGTTGRTYDNSCKLANTYGVDLRVIDIKEACSIHLRDIGIEWGDTSSAYENAQARERMQVLMDIANKENGLVVGTGNLSETALGWCTYNGDHMSMYNVNANVPKTLLRYIVEEVANKTNSEVLKDILDTPISPELLPPDENGNIAQKTEEQVGPYLLHDFFLYHFVRWQASPKEILEIAKETFKDRYSEDEIKKWLKVFLRKFFIAQFKRNCVPDSPKIGSVSLNSKIDFRMPSDIDGSLWEAEVEA